MPICAFFSRSKPAKRYPVVFHSTIKLTDPKIIDELKNFPMLNIKNSPLSFELKQNGKTLIFNKYEVKWLAEISIAERIKKDKEESIS
ncbi:hypothetical protein [Providencia alcalifaciens]|uniref:hypothetical protein n=1 Tax=Providencia alcalifaciens TaxID=126385 RepID=UPI002B05FD7E|nr:hypothetical protein [Providencia alcalifaciens]